LHHDDDVKDGVLVVAADLKSEIVRWAVEKDYSRMYRVLFLTIDLHFLQFLVLLLMMHLAVESVVCQSLILVVSAFECYGRASSALLG